MPSNDGASTQNPDSRRWISLLFKYWRHSMCCVMSIAALLTLLTQGQKNILNSGNQLDLDCEFFMDHFTMFDNPIVWKKSQLEEVTHVNTMRNIHAPFLLTNRFEVRFTHSPPRYRLQLVIKSKSLTKTVSVMWKLSTAVSWTNKICKSDLRYLRLITWTPNLLWRNS